MLEAAGADECVAQRSQIVCVLPEKRANRIELAEGHAKHQRPRQPPLALEHVQQANGA